jgi:RimJ/RimL family protein N-acetyltransferase
MLRVRPVRESDAMHVQASGPAPDEGGVALRAAGLDVRRGAGPWLMSGAARRGAAIWFAVEDAVRDELVGVAVLVRPDGAPSVEVGYAPGTAAGARAFAGAALHLVARKAFEQLGISRLETRTREPDDLLAAMLRGVGFTWVGHDRDNRVVWSLVPRDLR